MNLRPILHTQIPGPRSRELAQTLRRHESPNITYIADDFPIFWASAQGCWVTDVDGNTFLDMTSAFGVAAIGHSHPDVVRAIQEQAPKLIHGMGDVHPSEVKVALCEKIAALAPIPNAQTILGQNGGDAVEAALKTAAIATKKAGVIAFNGGYHGLSYGALDVTSRADFRAPFSAQLGHFTTHLPYGCAIEQIETELAGGLIGAVIVEPIQGRGGIVVPPPGWLAEVKSCCECYSALLIFDEIFTGWGRTGSLFACEYEGVTPDILCIGKAMGGGLPISACVASAKIMAAWGESQGEALHTSTFLGNPLACAAALAAIGVIERGQLHKRAGAMGAYFKDELLCLQTEFPTVICEIRGRGLMLGIQFATKETALNLVSEALQNGLILLPAGDGSVLELIPPLTITHDEIQCFLSIFRPLLNSV